MNMNEEQNYINFDEYIKASEPHKRERAEAWRVAIGLQAVDGLQVSEYLKQTARQHIEGEITIDEARELLEYSHFMIGVNGVVTFKKSTLPEALAEVPLTRLVLETDAPYLAPVPFRGKRNEPSYVKRVAVKLSELYEKEIGEVERQTTANALKIFKTEGK